MEAPEAALDPFRTVSEGKFSEVGLPLYGVLGSPVAIELDRSVADGGRGAVEARVGGLVEQEGCDVGAGDAGAGAVAAEVAGADGAGAGAVGGAGEARGRPVEGAVGDELRQWPAARGRRATRTCGP